jgi:hypothetical protein
MKNKLLLVAIYLTTASIATVLTNNEITGDIDFGRSLRHHIVKRKGGGGRGSSSRAKVPKTSSRQQPKTADNYPYPKQQYSQKQPPYNPSYNPAGGHNTGYNPGMI